MEQASDMSHSTAQATFDIAIVGGGLVGASLALALAGTGLSLVVIEAQSPESESQPSFDDRTTALGNGSRRVFEALGIWSKLAEEAAPIRRIHVSDAGRFGFARVEAQQLQLDALGYVVSNRVLGRELWAALRATPAVTLRMPAQVRQVQLAAAGATLEVQDADGVSMLQARLVVAADGAQSLVRRVAGIGAQRNDYAQTAIVTTLRTDQPLDGTAHERFTTQGPMALLPLRSTHQGNWHGLVWAAAPDEAVKLLALDDAQFMQQWQQAFGWRAGAALQLGRRASYPLSLQQADATVATRAVLLGNASQALHPVAGQGFNLGLRDAAELAEVLAEAVAEGLDPGSAQVLARFEAQRGADRQGVVRFTDALVRVFSDTRPGVAALRDLGLLAFDLLPVAKQALSRVSLGFGTQTPRLTRGQALR